MLMKACLCSDLVKKLCNKFLSVHSLAATHLNGHHLLHSPVLKLLIQKFKVFSGAGVDE